MKWIGQSIVDFIARFRSDVYLDSPTAGGSDPDKFLGIDSDGKIIYRTGTEVLSDTDFGVDINALRLKRVVEIVLKEVKLLSLTINGYITSLVARSTFNSYKLTYPTGTIPALITLAPLTNPLFL